MLDFRNYTQLLHDFGFYGIVWNSFFIVLVAVALSLVAGLGLALLLISGSVGTQVFPDSDFSDLGRAMDFSGDPLGLDFQRRLRDHQFHPDGPGVLVHTRNWLASDLSAQLVIVTRLCLENDPVYDGGVPCRAAEHPHRGLGGRVIDGASLLARLRSDVLPLTPQLLMIIGRSRR